MLSAGYLIYSGIMPLLKTIITIGLGYVLAYKNLFPAAASRGASQVAMNVALPALIFSSVVPSFTPSNISAIGPLAMLAVLYILIGAVFGYIIREVCYVPRNFWQGIVVATSVSNWGSLTPAIVLSITQESPFDPAKDPDLGISFVSIFIVVYYIFFWVLGMAHSLSWDYLPGVPQGEDAEVRVPWEQKPIGRFIAKTLRRRRNRSSGQSKTVSPVAGTEDIELSSSGNCDGQVNHKAVAKGTSCMSIASIRSGGPAGDTLPAHCAEITVPQEESSPPSKSTFIARFCRAISIIVTPITLSIALALPIALVTPLKALFVDTTVMGGPSWKGPDGKPPLAFLLDTCRFVGGVAVPMALILLGAAFARIKIPRPISRLPIAAMLSVCGAKLVLLPVIGVFLVQAMVKGGMIPKDAKAEIFVAIFVSGTPSAVNQLIASELYSTTGDVDTLSAFLLVQYVLMFLSSAVLTAISLLMI